MICGVFPLYFLLLLVNISWLGFVYLLLHFDSFFLIYSLILIHIVMTPVVIVWFQYLLFHQSFWTSNSTRISLLCMASVCVSVSPPQQPSLRPSLVITFVLGNTQTTITVTVIYSLTERPNKSFLNLCFYLYPIASNLNGIILFLYLYLIHHDTSTIA